MYLHSIPSHFSADTVYIETLLKTPLHISKTSQKRLPTTRSGFRDAFSDMQRRKITGGIQEKIMLIGDPLPARNREPRGLTTARSMDYSIML